MEKPTLDDFDLTDKSNDIYNQQLLEYHNMQEIISQKRNKRNRIVIVLCCVPATILFILFIVFTRILNSSVEGSAVGCIFLLIATIAYPCIVAKLFYISDFPLSNFEKNKRENFENSLGLIIDKYQYVDKKLEENLHNYDVAISAFNDYQLKLTIDFWVNLSGYQFEQEVARLYTKIGYSSYVTKATGDGGIDIILTKGTERIAVQCKHHKNKVGPNDVRALQGVVYNGNYSYGIFVSLNGFTPTVEKEIEMGKVRIELITIKDLLAMQKSIYK